MKVSRRDAIIDLTAEEGAAFLGNADATPEMLADRHHPAGGYQTFKDKVEHVASEIAYETGRTVEIYAGEGEERIAYCDDRDGLVVEANANKPERQA